MISTEPPYCSPCSAPGNNIVCIEFCIVSRRRKPPIFAGRCGMLGSLPLYSSGLAETWRSLKYDSIKELIELGVWNIASWMAFLLAYQIAHKEMTNLANMSSDIVSFISKIQFLAFGSLFWDIWSTGTSSESAQTQCAIVQLRRECLHEHPACTRHTNSNAPYSGDATHRRLVATVLQVSKGRPWVWKEHKFSKLMFKPSPLYHPPMNDFYPLASANDVASLWWGIFTLTGPRNVPHAPGSKPKIHQCSLCKQVFSISPRHRLVKIYSKSTARSKRQSPVWEAPKSIGEGFAQLKQWVWVTLSWEFSCLPIYVLSIHCLSSWLCLASVYLSLPKLQAKSVMA